MGGLGNNLSQLLVAFLLKERGFTIEVVNNLCTVNFITRFLKWTIHDQSTSEIYHEKFKLLHVKTLSVIMDLFWLKVSFFFNIRIFNRLFDSNRLSSIEDIVQKSLGKQKIILGGYWQNLNIYNEINLKKFKQFILGGDLKYNNKNDSGCIHIRGGDFLKLNKHLGKSYYIKAIHYLRNSKSLMVYTNDREYADQVLQKSIPYKYSDNKNAKEDFLEMLYFKEMVCSNSTFSIWAGLLSNAELIVLPDSDEKSLKLNIDANTFNSKKIIPI